MVAAGFPAPRLHAYGVAIDSISTVVRPLPVTGESVDSIEIRFTTPAMGETFNCFNMQDGCYAMFTLGVHIGMEDAAPAGYGTGNSVLFGSGADFFVRNGGLFDITPITGDPTDNLLNAQQPANIRLSEIIKQGIIIIEKETIPDATLDDFSFTSPTLSEIAAQSPISDGENITVLNIDPTNNPPATHIVTEVDPTPGFDLTDLDCDDDASTSPSTTNLGDREAIINVDPGETVTCTFTNTERGSITIVKDTIPLDDPQDFGYTHNVDGSGPFNLDDDSTDATLPNTKEFSNVAPGLFTVTEDDPTPDGFGLTGLSCVDSDGTGTASSLDLPSRTATINLDPGETVTCTFTNEKADGFIIVEKEIVDPNQVGPLSIIDFADYTIDGATVALNVAVPVEADVPHIADENQQPNYVRTYDTVGSECDLNGSVTVAAGETKTCKIINTYQPGFVKVTKVTLPAGELGPFEATISSTDGGNIAGIAAQSLGGDGSMFTWVVEAEKTYVVTETDKPDIFDQTDNTCSNLSPVSGATETCTITNTKKGTLKVTKVTPDGFDGLFGFDVEDGALLPGETLDTVINTEINNMHSFTPLVSATDYSLNEVTAPFASTVALSQVHGGIPSE